MGAPRVHPGRRREHRVAVRDVLSAGRGVGRGGGGVVDGQVGRPEVVKGVRIGQRQRDDDAFSVAATAGPTAADATAGAVGRWCPAFSQAEGGVEGSCRDGWANVFFGPCSGCMERCWKT